MSDGDTRAADVDDNVGDDVKAKGEASSVKGVENDMVQAEDASAAEAVNSFPDDG